MMSDRDPAAAVSAASACWHEPERAEALLQQALADTPDSEIVLIGGTGTFVQKVTVAASNPSTGGS